MTTRLARFTPAMIPSAFVLLLSCNTATCDCLPNLSHAAVAGNVLTSQQQGAAAAVVSFFAAAGPACDPNGTREPLYAEPTGTLQITTDQAGGFSTGLSSGNSGVRCVWVVAKANDPATDSTVATVVTEFIPGAVPDDTVTVTLTLPAAGP